MFAEGIHPLHEPKNVLSIFYASGGAFTLALVDIFIGSAGVVSAVLCLLLWVWVAGPSGVDVTNILIDAVGVLGCP